MPRVGSSIMIMSAFVFSHLATMVFCWLPPLRKHTFWSTFGVTILRLSTNFWAMYFSSFLFSMNHFFTLSSEAITIFLLIDMDMKSPSLFLSSVMKAKPFFTLSPGLRMLITFPSFVIVPAVFLSTPNKSRMISVRPAPTRPVKPSTSPL